MRLEYDIIPLPEHPGGWPRGSARLLVRRDDPSHGLRSGEL